MSASEPITMIDYVVQIPNDEGNAFVSSVTIKVPVEIDPDTGDQILGDEALELIEDARLRHMGLMTPAEIKALRESFKLSQVEMAAYLQAGDKSYARWETGTGRQSRLVNNYLMFLRAGKISLSDLAANLPQNFRQDAYEAFWKALSENGTIYTGPSVGKINVQALPGSVPLASYWATQMDASLIGTGAMGLSAPRLLNARLSRGDNARGADVSGYVKVKDETTTSQLAALYDAPLAA